MTIRLLSTSHRWLWRIATNWIAGAQVHQYSSQFWLLVLLFGMLDTRRMARTMIDHKCHSSLRGAQVHLIYDILYSWRTISFWHPLRFFHTGMREWNGAVPEKPRKCTQFKYSTIFYAGMRKWSGAVPGKPRLRARSTRPTQSFTLACENGVGLYPAFPTTFYESPTMGWWRWWRWILAMALFSHWLPRTTAFYDSIHWDPTSGLVYVPEDLLPQLWPESWWWTPRFRMATITGTGHCDWNYIGCVETGENQTQERYQHPRPTSTTWLPTSTWFEMVGAMAMCIGFQRTRNRHI